MFLLFQTPEELTKETLDQRTGCIVYEVSTWEDYPLLNQHWGNARFGEAWRGMRPLRDHPVYIRVARRR